MADMADRMADFSPPTLTEFLLARVAEDETPFHGPRVLAECEAKRRIVYLHRSADFADTICIDSREEPWPCDTLKALALPYAEHPDCREEWRP